MTALGLNAKPLTQGGDNVGHYVEHGKMDPEHFDYEEVYEQTYMVNGREYHVSHTLQVVFKRLT